MNPLRAFRDVFSSDPAYHARRDAEKAVALMERAREIVGDQPELRDDVICSARGGRVRIGATDFLEMLLLAAEAKLQAVGRGDPMASMFEGGSMLARQEGAKVLARQLRDAWEAEVVERAADEVAKLVRTRGQLLDVQIWHRSPYVFRTIKKALSLAVLRGHLIEISTEDGKAYRLPVPPVPPCP